MRVSACECAQYPRHRRRLVLPPYPFARSLPPLLFLTALTHGGLFRAAANAPAAGLLDDAGEKACIKEITSLILGDAIEPATIVYSHRTKKLVLVLDDSVGRAGLEALRPKISGTPSKPVRTWRRGRAHDHDAGAGWLRRKLPVLVPRVFRASRADGVADELTVRCLCRWNVQYAEMLKVDQAPLGDKRVKGVIVTLRNRNADQKYHFISRYFAPWNGIPEGTRVA